MKTLIYYLTATPCLWIYLFTQRQCLHISLSVCIYKYIVSKCKLIGGETLEYVSKEDFCSNMWHYCEIALRWQRVITNVGISVADYWAEIWNVMSRTLGLSRHPFLEDMDLKLLIKFKYSIWTTVCVCARLCSFVHVPTHAYMRLYTHSNHHWTAACFAPNIFGELYWE